jgi:ATP-dependent RNA circularization protein (DNA/RNA ligase family)
MKQFPSIPRVANAPGDLFEEGHLWLFEKVDGANFRFQVQETGQLRFGDRSRVYDEPDSVPDPYQHAVSHIRTNLDQHALQQAVDDVEAFVFFGEAMHHHTIDYDWDRTPSFLGFDVWSTIKEGFLPMDTVEQIFERLGLQPVNAFERERRAQDFDPDSYAIPQSRWYDGPAEGVVIRNKQGKRAKLLHPDFREVDDTVPVDGSATDLAEKFATQHRFDKLAAKFEDRERSVTFQALYEQALEDIVREEHKQLYHGSQSVDMSEFRSEVAARTQAFLDDAQSRSGPGK